MRKYILLPFFSLIFLVSRPINARNSISLEQLKLMNYGANTEEFGKCNFVIFGQININLTHLK